MHTAVEVFAVADETGNTRLRRSFGDGSLAVRATAVGRWTTVHLVGTAAGPLDGDTIGITLDVASGAALRLRSAAATVALPGRRHPGDALSPATIALTIRVATGGFVDVDLEPVIVTSGAHLSLTTRIEAAASSSVHVVETVIGGRHGEASGRWASDVRLATDLGAVAHQSLDDLIGPGRVVITSVSWPSPASEPVEVTGDDDCGAVVCFPAAGGRTVTAWGPTLATARATLADLSPR